MREAIWTKQALRRLVQREMGDYRLVVVSNRQPYLHEIIDGKLQHVSPSGGLITAIDPLMQESGGTWIAQSGGQADWQAVDEQNKVPVPPDDPSYILRLVWLAEHDARGHYDGFSNAALWPLCHNAYIEPVFETGNWESYKAVNNVFADPGPGRIGRPTRGRFYPGLPLCIATESVAAGRPRNSDGPVLAHSLAQSRDFPHLPLAGGVA